MVSLAHQRQMAAFAVAYRSCIIRSAADAGAIRPDRATLRLFALRHGRDYAAIQLGGDQPRLIAHDAFAFFASGLGVLSTQPIPRQPAVS